METLALILAGGKGSRLDILSEKRSKPAVPFAGKFRIIDFSLSNCANSGIYDIAILTQYQPFSLNEHIGSGKPWDLDRRDSQITLLQPHNEWYMGTADSVLKNLNFIKRKDPKYILILSGDHIYKMNYKKMIEFHQANEAKLTIATQQVPIDEAHRFGIMETDQTHRIIGFEEKPNTPKSNQASMGIYVFSADALYDYLDKIKDPNLDFGKHIIPNMINNKDTKVYGFEFSGYWRDVGTYDSYLQTNIELLNMNEPRLDLYSDAWKIYTRSEEMPPVRIGHNAKIENSLISNGSVIDGTVINSVLSPGVRVEKGAIVRDSVILNNTIISENAVVDHCIIDKKVYIGRNAKLGYSEDYTSNQERPTVLYSGINVIEKHGFVPDNAMIPRNCRIYRNAKFETLTLKSGSTVR
ncbi:MAG: glucose-1-phosphate adenylyltransferase [Acholeplasma sp.]|nr:glucose-1-phosphate adenylyltransferase [Acholeplasma sp.]